MSSLITAFILFWFGSSTIRGFALVLMIGVLTSMFTAITVSRTILRTIVRWQWTRKASLYGVNEEEFVTATPRGTRRTEIRHLVPDAPRRPASTVQRRDRCLTLSESETGSSCSAG